MLSLENITKTFNQNIVLKNVNAKFNLGMNFIVGPSGSGKSTLLKILSGIDKEHEGSVLFREGDLKRFKESKMNEYYYSSVGFIWQDFKLIEHLSVEENILLALEISSLSDKEKINKLNNVLRSLSIQNLAKKSISKLSGGQKQRVAIARAIIKDPEIIIADEPTAALDKKSSEMIINILKKLSDEKTVIVVTHDKSLVDKESNCFELKGGQLIKISETQEVGRYTLKEQKKRPRLSLKGALRIGCKNFRGLMIKFISLALIVAISSYLLLLNVNNTVTNENEQIINSLIEERGDRLKDIIVTKGVIGAHGTSNEESTSIDIKQDISGVFDKYKNDERVEHIAVDTSLMGMNITIDNILDDYRVERSSYQPIPGSMIKGRMPKVEGKEVAVTKLFVENAGLNIDEIIGKNIDLKTTVLDHDGSNSYDIENYTERNIDIKDIEIVGIIDSTEKFVMENGQVYETEVEDGFYYSVEIAKQINGAKDDEMSFTMRIKDIKDIPPIVEELENMGITAFGEFKEIQDLLMINNSTSNQSNSISIIIGVLAVVVTILTTIVNAYLRKNEISILRINGYSRKSIFKISLIENLLISGVSIALLIVIYPFISSISQNLINVAASKEDIFIGIVIAISQGIIMTIISTSIYYSIKINNNLTGSKR